MAPLLPTVSAKEVVRAFERLGWLVARQRGSHIIMTKDNHRATLSVPDHNPVAKGTLRGLIRAAGISVDDFISELR
jgi:predicted RNA binding protein YcfA (HicA-like mRNA interferase family)